MLRMSGSTPFQTLIIYHMKAQYLSSISHDLFNFQLMLIGVIGGQNDYYSVGTFASSIAGMTSQIRPLQLISSSGGLYWLFAWQRMDDRLENAITFTKISVL